MQHVRLDVKSSRQTSIVHSCSLQHAAAHCFGDNMLPVSYTAASTAPRHGGERVAAVSLPLWVCLHLTLVVTSGMAKGDPHHVSRVTRRPGRNPERPE